jgi:hypothetical protein
LLIKLLTNESSALLLAQHALLLLFVVKQLVELLDSGPLIIFCDFTVNLSLSSYSAGGHGDVIIENARLRFLRNSGSYRNSVWSDGPGSSM